jgi:cytochrome c-type biogenesis protein CcmH
MRYVFAVLLLIAAPAFADSSMPAAEMANTQLSDPAKEAKAKALMETIRCLVCQGQSVADSNADLAGDMRALIRRRIDQGEEPEAVRSWLVQRYGDWVTYDPPLSARTSILWALPLLLIGLGLLAVRGRFRRRAR